MIYYKIYGFVCGIFLPVCVYSYHTEVQLFLHTFDYDTCTQVIDAPVNGIDHRWLVNWRFNSWICGVIFKYARKTEESKSKPVQISYRLYYLIQKSSLSFDFIDKV